MNILLIHNYYQQAGGEDYVFETEGKLLSRHGHAVHYLTFDNDTIRTWKDKLAAALGVIYNRKSARRLEKEIRYFNPDIIHVHNFLPLASPAVFMVAKKYGIPVVLTLHNYRLLCPGATLFYRFSIYEKSIRRIFPIDAIWKGVYRNSKLQTAAVALMTAFHRLTGTWKNKIDRYIVLTNFARDKFGQSVLGIPQKKFVLKPNFVGDSGKGEKKRNNFFLFAGRLTVEKGVHTLLKAAQHDGFNLAIIGDGPLRGMVEGASRLYPNIRYMGFKAKGEVLYYLKHCRALIFPSILYETFGMTIIEAFSTATPVVASRLGAMKELVQDGINGLLFEAGNSTDLGRAVKQLTTDTGLEKSLSINARITFLRKYTAKINYKILHGIYQEVIKDKNPLGVKKSEQHLIISE
ncbi:glycosyl transferase, group 1 [Fulvivirga imtechensis AK7]|uniref:Glycosyl transferase, group 1 n=1 Tax=Fulvivirga imtechensis AK7 TaxID=1237149 RepID=L8JVJ3_9BACT|nr:glycosyltransferase family 4 protein [Fulvivirga imtechensis]ELR71634.1 glycosyl transferase, group 1 [Fulvivirga imtechensis AK7]